MSPTPTPSVSSVQTQYYDTLAMQTSAHATEEPSASSSVASLREASGGLGEVDRHTETGSLQRRADDEAEQKTPSLRSLPIEPASQEEQTPGTRSIFGRPSSTVDRKGSIRTTKSTHAIPAAPFANGAPLMGPNAEPNIDKSLFARSADAERTLSQKQKNRIAKEEEKESKKFLKLLKTESTTEKVALDSALQTLSALQGLHKTAIRREAKAETSHAKALSAAQKSESRFQEEKARAAELRARAEARCAEERARWEGKEGEVRAQEERLNSAKETVREMEERIAECAREVERLRIVKGTDEREREAKICELVGQK